jgi:hypothetical protein
VIAGALTGHSRLPHRQLRTKVPERRASYQFLGKVVQAKEANRISAKSAVFMSQSESRVTSHESRRAVVVVVCMVVVGR